MPIKAGATLSAVTPRVAVSGAFVIPQTVRVRVANAWEIVFGALSASLSPTTLTATGVPGSNYLTANATVSVSSGIGPFEYSFRRISGDPQITATVPTQTTAATSAVTQFQAFVTEGDLFTAVFVCDVTDQETGQLVTTNSVTITASGGDPV